MIIRLISNQAYLKQLFMGKDKINIIVQTFMMKSNTFHYIRFFSIVLGRRNAR